MKRFALILAAGAALAGSPAAIALAHAEAAIDGGDAVFRTTTLNLSAFGETSIAPDQATITLGVTTQGATAAAAMQANRARMNATVAALKGQGIEAKDIQTTGLNLNPQYTYAQNQPPKLNGYQASNAATITVRDLAKLGATVDAVVQAGANEINGIAFGLSNPQAAEDQARRAAVKALAAKAALYADASGYRLVRLVNLSEGGGYQVPPPRPFAMARLAAAPAPTPVEPGEVKVRIDVSGVYELAAR
jgi:uncharacterized protein YggE